MTEISERQREAQTARGLLREAEENLYALRNRLRSKQSRLARARQQAERGVETVRQLEKEIIGLESQIGGQLRAVEGARAGLSTILEQFPIIDRPWELVEKLGDHLPFLLLPVRIETRFMNVATGKELWVRIFPDDIAVDTHEKTLTEDEVNAGLSYWRELWAAAREIEEEERQKREKGAWRALAEAHGGTRAAWIASQTRPQTLDVSSLDELVFPDFPPETLKAESWSKAPISNVMPDRFVVMTFSNGQEIHRQLGNVIPQPLALGPDPQKAEEEYKQVGGDLLVGEDIAWIYNFDRAVEVGMGVRIPLQELHAKQGFDRVLVLGLRLSSDEQESRELIETLLENHRYAPDGLSLIPQGTPTNNTGGEGAGYSSADPGAEASFELETGDPLFEPIDDPFQKSDGQRLAEALGINHELLQRVKSADQRDFKEALAINKALWPGTIGYYLEEMLGLDLTTVGNVREFFTDNVTGRGPVAAIRVGTQPYGVLLTSDFSRWKWSRSIDGQRFTFLNRLYDVLRRVEGHWRQLVANVARVGAPGDPFQNLLGVLGLQATSVEYYRRRAVNKEYIWNYEIMNRDNISARRMMFLWELRARALLQELGLEFDKLPRIFDLSFFLKQDAITDPLIEDIAVGEQEKLSETRVLKSIYKVPNRDDADSPLETNYIGWLVASEFDVIKQQRFENLAGEPQPIPRPLLYRMLRGALLQAYHDASMQVYDTFGVLTAEARSEVALSNIAVDRTVTRWELMEADVSRVVPQLSQVSQSLGQFLQSDEGLARPEALSLADVRACLEALKDVHTARLERIFAEHIDLSTYRLEAWQTGCFYRRLLQQRYPQEREAKFENRVQGIYLGAFGWLENLRPAPELVPADLSSVPRSLHDPRRDGPLFNQADNAGFIHGPSLNHAVAAAVLRNAYLTHFDPASPDKMAVNLSSARVRLALGLLEGIRNGQELGALLGYQFERGLHDRYGDPSLNQFIPLIRQKYPLVADKITPDEEGGQIETKEARNVLDGYALLEAAFLKETPEPYPYGVVGLPGNPASTQALAIQAEVARLADSFDAIADLSLAEGVYQVVQGNFDRAGAMLRAVTEGNSPPDAEIVRTPRTGAAISQRVALHFETTGTITSPWPGTISERARVEPGLNRWLGTLLPTPDRIRYVVSAGAADGEPQELIVLGLQPIDLVCLIGDDLVGETTELESRIAYETRRIAGDDAIEIKIDFIARDGDPQSVTLFELLPLLRTMRALVTSARPLAADDFLPPSEATTDPAVDANIKGFDLVDLRTRVEAAMNAFDGAITSLRNSIPPFNTEGEPNLTVTSAENLRLALKRLADFGLPDAFPLSAFGETDEAKRSLVNQGVLTLGAASFCSAAAIQLKAEADAATLGEEKFLTYRAAAREIFGPTFNLIPIFNLKNPAEVEAAALFRDAAAGGGLTRFHQDNPHIVDEWLQGISRVRDKVGTLENVLILGEAFDAAPVELRPLQLPFREADHWVAVEYPEVAREEIDNADKFVPEGEFLSLVQWLAEGGFDAGAPQRGLLVDEWTEVIPGRQETTGIAVHFNQPNSEPPQALLLAVTPEVTGAWSWDKLVGILQDTFDRARQRAVEPDQLDTTAYGHLLPAILSAAPSFRFATIATDLIHQTAVAGSSLGPEDE
jgi:hypothetical protein